MAEYGESLSKREMDVLLQLMQGLSNKEIAQALFISPHTVKVHLKRINIKLGATSRTEAMFLAMEKGLIGLPTENLNKEEPLETTVDNKRETEPEIEREETEHGAKLELTGAGKETALNTADQDDGQAVSQTEHEPIPTMSRWLIWGAIGLLFLIVAILVGPTLFATPNSLATLPPAPTSTPFSELRIADSHWYETRALPEPRTAASMIAVGNDLYLFGGRDEMNRITADLYTFDVGSKIWEEKEGKPTAVVGAETAELFGEIFLIGGLTADDTLSAKVEVYSPAQNRWRPAADLPKPLAHGVAVSDESFVYYMGGLADTGGVDTIYRYDSRQNEWQSLAPMPEALIYASGGLIDGQIYLVGGSMGTQCYRYDLTLDSWSTCPPLPESRHNTTGLVIQNKLYIFGGEPAGDGLIYDPQEDHWATEELPLILNQGVAVANVEAQLYFFGGTTNTAEIVNDGYKYTPLIYQWFLPVSIDSGGSGSANE